MEEELFIDDEYEDDDELEFDCGFVIGEGCTLGGTEECEFDCPYHDLIIASPYFPNCDLLGNEANDPDEE